jgi:hypothetical protein
MIEHDIIPRGEATVMKRRTKIATGGAMLIGAAAAGTGIAAASGATETETPITGPALATASAVALDHAGGGKVTGTERGDEESYYEVEVTRPDGTRTDVQLDRDFRVVSGLPDHDVAGAAEDGGNG